jgi:hypothetical protein
LHSNSITPGDSYERLTIIRECDSIYYGKRKQRVRVFECLCVCGAVKKVPACHWGATKSCGCLAREISSVGNRTHGDTHAPEYEAWRSIFKRCNRADYKAHGITVCERWQSYLLFRADVGRRPSDKHSLDRIDNDGNYEPGNVRWATAKMQCRNKRNNRWVNYKGERRLLIEVCEETGIHICTIAGRIRGGWEEKDLFKPPMQKSHIAQQHQ